MEDKTIEQKICCDKVLEGLLKDITFGNDLISGALSDINNMQKSNNTFQERENMDDHGRGITEMPGENLDQPGEIVEEKKSANVIDLCADIVDSVGEQSSELQKIAAHASMLNKSQLEMMEQVEACNISLSVIAAEVGKIAETAENEQGDTADQQKS